MPKKEFWIDFSRDVRVLRDDPLLSAADSCPEQAQRIYRVVVGLYPSLDSAQSAARQLEALGYGVFVV